MKNLLLRVLVLGALLGFSSFASAVDHCEEIHNLKIGDEVNLWLIKDGKKIQITSSITIDEIKGILVGYNTKKTTKTFSKIYCKDGELIVHHFMREYIDNGNMRPLDMEAKFEQDNSKWFSSQKGGVLELIILKKTSLVSN